jgi:hypothetical protein
MPVQRRRLIAALYSASRAAHRREAYVAKIELFQGFFSYTHLDAELDPDLVEALTTRLEMRVTRKLTNGSFSIWRDVDKIRTGQQWDERIGAAVRASQVFIVLMTPKWFERDYCCKEYRIFQEVEQGIAVGEHVVPLLAHAIKPQDFDQEQKATFDDLNRRQYKKTIATTFRKMTADQREIIVDEIADDIEGMIERLRGKSTPLQPRATAQQAATEQKDKAARALAYEQRKPQLDVAFNPDIPGCRRYFEDAQTTHFRMKIRNSSEQTIRNCRGRVNSVEYLEAQESSPYVEKVPLTWALLRDIHEIDLQPGDDMFLNVIEMGSAARFIAMSNANNPPHPFDSIGKYRCTVVVTSDDTAANNVAFIFDWTGNQATAAIRNVSIS